MPDTFLDGDWTLSDLAQFYAVLAHQAVLSVGAGAFVLVVVGWIVGFAKRS